jgi:hypothetical protein
MERLEELDREAFVREMQGEVRAAMLQVADAVNGACDGQVINGSEMAVRDAMDALKRKAFEKALQMRIDSTESTFSPSQGRVGESHATSPGKNAARHNDHERAR